MSFMNDDVALFNTIDEMIRTEADVNSERRTCERKRYDCIQLLAPFDGTRLPEPREFRQVRCQDLSVGGFSFYCFRRPDTPFVIVALGLIPFMFVEAEIKHVRPTVTDNGNENFVGCRFTRKITG